MSQKIKETQVFTPKWVTNAMLDLLDQRDFQADDTYYFEPSCGDGQMLEVLLDRIYQSLLNKYENDVLKALADTCFKFYAIEIDPELVVKARTRIWKYIMSKVTDNFKYDEFVQILFARLVADKIECKDFFSMFGENK